MSTIENLLDTIICGDALTVLDSIAAQTIGLVLTSPPYNVGVEYEGYSDKEEFRTHIKRLLLVLRKCVGLLSPGGHLVVQSANTGGQPYRPMNSILNVALKAAIPMRGEIIWDKQNITAQTAWGSWLSANKPSIREQHEYLSVFRKDGERCGQGDISGADFMDLTRSIWRVTPETGSEHPAAFPVRLAARAIRLYSFVGEIILDPYVGSGTTCVAAKVLGRHYLGIDISADYCEMARKRIAEVPENLFGEA